jgi:hypothetical protein
MKQTSIIGYFCGALLLIYACSQSDVPDNPFEGQIIHQDTVKLDLLQAEYGSFAWIYKQVLHPTCANVGCHDGTFEPDYRTMESSYNTLVYQIPIKNDGNYTYRVEPYKPQTSVLMARLKDQLTPAMPFQIEPDSDWPQKKVEYISAIEAWINKGAPDIMGNTRQITYPAPVLLGAAAMHNGTWLPRTGITGPIQMPTDASMARLYFAFRHQYITPLEFQYNRIAFTSNADNVTGQVQQQLQILSTPVYERGFYGDIVAYTHYIDLQPSTAFDQQQQQWYFRVYVQDDQNPVTEIPTDNGIYYIKRYMSFRWAE